MATSSDRKWWSQQTSVFDPAYILLLTGCDCFFSGKKKSKLLKLFSFLICLPLYINQICKYCTFWVICVDCVVSTQACNKEKKKSRGKKEEKKSTLAVKTWKTPEEPCCTVSAFISRPAREWMCHSVTKQYTLQHLHEKQTPSSLVEVADFRSSTSTQKRVLYLVSYHCLFKSSSVWAIKMREYAVDVFICTLW